MTIHKFSSFDNLHALDRDRQLLRWAPQNPFDQRPDLHLAVTSDRNRATGCCSLWWRENPEYKRTSTGTIGHFFARDRDSARLLLTAATTHLKEAGVEIAIGPMDGNTWRRYRFVTKSGNDPFFFLEPENPPEWPDYFKEAGFSPLAHYTSNLLECASAPDARLARTQLRMEGVGVRIRNIDMKNFTDELRSIYAVSNVSFQDNFLYTPLPENLFLAQYQHIAPLVHPDLVLIAEHGERPVAFAFAIPDFLEKQSGRKEQTAILKTLAVLPGRDYAGLGTLLAGLIHEKAATLGFPRLIHALMHETNSSRNLAKDGARVIREYTLYSKTL